MTVVYGHILFCCFCMFCLSVLFMQNQKKKFVSVICFSSSLCCRLSVFVAFLVRHFCFMQNLDN